MSKTLSTLTKASLLSHRQELDAVAQFLPIKTMLPSTDYVRNGSLEKMWFSLINWVKITGPRSSATDFKEEEENPLQFRGMEKPGRVPFKKQTL